MEELKIPIVVSPNDFVHWSENRENHVENIKAKTRVVCNVLYCEYRPYFEAYGKKLSFKASLKRLGSFGTVDPMNTLFWLTIKMEQSRKHIFDINYKDCNFNNES